MLPVLRTKVAVTLEKVIHTRSGNAYLFSSEKKISSYNIVTRYFTYLKEDSTIPIRGVEYMLEGILKVTKREYNDKFYLSYFVNSGRVSIVSEDDYEYCMLNIKPNKDLDIQYDYEKTSLIKITPQDDSVNMRYILVNNSRIETTKFEDYLYSDNSSEKELLITSGWHKIDEDGFITFRGYIADMRSVVKQPNSKFTTITFRDVEGE